MTKYIWLAAIVIVGIVIAGSYRVGFTNGSKHTDLQYMNRMADLTTQLQRKNYEANKIAYTSDMSVVDAKLAKLFGAQDLVSACAKLCTDTLQSKGGHCKCAHEEVDTELLSSPRDITTIGTYFGYFDDPIDAGDMSTDTPIN